jgi:sugar transferase (PEP-CTERM system associated)
MATVKILKYHFRVPFIILLLIEAAVLFLSSYIAVYLWSAGESWNPEQFGFELFTAKAITITVGLLLGMVAMGQYQTQRPSGQFLLGSIFFRNAISLVLGTLGLWIFYYVVPALWLGRGVFALSVLSSLVILTAIRFVFYCTVDSSVLRRRVLVLGGGEPAAGLLREGEAELNLSPRNRGYTIHGFVPMEGETVCVPNDLCVYPDDGLSSYCKLHEIDEIVVAVKDRRNALPTQALLDCKLMGVNVVDFISFHERERGMLHLDILQPSWMIFSDGYGASNVRMALERLFDMVASASILVLTSPFLLLTTIAIYLESGFKGPIFYRQKRVGLNNSEFELFKFRSMCVDAEKDGKAVWAKENDNRITRVGLIIRKTRIDEIPQLINVLRGDMSVVGPRPERPEFVEQLEKSIPYYRIRHRVKPGLAGWAQIKYPYGASEADAYNKLQFDLFYIKNRTFFMDVLVLLQTIEVVILGRGAR